MFNVLEQPWPAAVIALLSGVVILQIRNIFPEKQRWWQLVIPLAVVAAGVGLDRLVATDREKIFAVVAVGVDAVERGDVPRIARIVTDDYEDPFHQNKAQFLTHCKRGLSQSPVQKLRRLDKLPEISGGEATLTLVYLVTFEPNAKISQDYKPNLMLKIRLHLAKQSDKRWLIDSVTPMEVDKQPISWSAY